MKKNTLILLMVLSWLPFSIYSQSITVGIIKDAAENEFEILSQLVKSEIEAITSVIQEVDFKEFNTNWQLVDVSQYYNEFLNDEDVDVIITLGYLSSDFVSQQLKYPKPVIAASVLDYNFQNLPLHEDKSSGVKNFTWIDSFVRLEKDIEDFSNAFEFNHLSIIIPYHILESFPDIIKFLDGLSYDFEISFVPINGESELLQLLPEQTDASLVFPLIQHSPEAIEDVFIYLNNHGIPSMVINGTGYLDSGATITFTNQGSFQTLARKLAVRVFKSIEGENLATIPSIDEQKSRIPIINMESLRLIGNLPKWSILDDAILLNVEKMPGDELTLQNAIAIALENNLKEKITNMDLLLAEKDIKIARSTLLPQIELSGSGIQLSKNIVESSMGQKGEFSIYGTASLKQVIFSEAAFANIAIKELVAENIRINSTQTALDLILEVSQAYVSLLLAKNNLQIVNDNVYTTLKNLELARSMKVSGEGTISDVNRWITELSLNKIELNNAEANYKTAMFRLNELLNIPISQSVPTPDYLDFENSVLIYQEILSIYLNKPSLTNLYADFVLEEMILNSPELKQIINTGDIVGRQKNMYSRQRYLPEIAIIGGAEQAFVRNGTISNPHLPVPAPPDDITWNLGLRLNIPVFDGGRRKNHVQRAIIEQDKIDWQKEDFINNMETAIRSNVQWLLASYREVKLSETAAKAAEENFTLTQNAYMQGAISVTSLIDAQNSMMKAKHLSFSARTGYVLNLISTERLQGRFIFLDSEVDQAEYKRRLINLLNYAN